MIKLIVTDLDGTLLNDDKYIPEDFWHTERQLREKGITWVLASGRQYFTIIEQFEPVLDDVYILAENGALVLKGETQIHIDPLDRALAQELIVKSREVKDAWPILCGRDSAYIEDNHEPLLAEARKYYRRLKKTEDLTKVDDTVLKFTLCDFKGAEENSYKYFREYESVCRVAVAGEIFLDMNSLTSTKGTALKQIMQHCSVKPEEVMAFGDYMNDSDMLELAHHSFAMKNAHPDLIKSARHITGHDNNNNGVVVEVRRFFDL